MRVARLELRGGAPWVAELERALVAVTALDLVRVRVRVRLGF